MKGEDTKRLIVEKALELFSERGYDAVSVGEIADAVGIKAPSLYNHYKSKEAIFNAIVEETAEKYKRDTDKIAIHVENSGRDVPVFTDISEEGLYEKVYEIFTYSMRDDTVRKFRKMMTIEQFRSPELAALYTERYVERIIAYHAGIFRKLIAAGEIENDDPETLARMYVSPIILLLGVCDRQPERENECLEKLKAHVSLFYNTYNVKRGNRK